MRSLPRQWKTWSLDKNEGNHILFIKRSSMSKVITFIMYVDDIIVIGDAFEEMKKLIK